MEKINKILFYRIALIIIFLVLIFISFQNINYKKNIKEEYLFLGDSITERYNLQRYYSNYPIINSGIGGDKTIDILENMDNRVYKYKPNKVILLIGINDFTHNESVDYVYNNIVKIISGIKEKFPNCKIYVQSIYPINDFWSENYGSQTSPGVRNINDKVKEENDKLKKYCDKNKLTYVDVFSSLSLENGYLKDEYTEDGIHLSEEGYKEVTYIIKKNVFY